MPLRARQRFLAPASFLEIRTTLESACPYADHFHAAFSLGLILEGKTRFSLGGEERLAEKGDMVLIASGQAHSCNPLGGASRSYHMLFLDEAGLRAHAPALPKSLSPRRAVITDPALFRQALDMINELETRALPEPEIARTLAALLRTLEKRHACFAEGEVPPHSPRHAPLPPLCAESEPPLSVAALAQRTGIRRESFSRAVRQKTGLPPSRYLHCLRLEKARRMLRQGRSITEAALAAGYADQSHFHRMFVRFFSATPGCYRNGVLHPYKK